jgi:REP element-mobilizing transposase RayT
MSEYIHKAHNVSVLMYHIVCPAKYRRVVITDEVDKTIRDTCLEIEKRYEIKFIEIGTEGNHVHFLVQSVPMYSPTKIVTTIKSITAREVFKKHPEVKKELWGGEFWSDGYYIGTVGKYSNEEVIRNYVKEQGTEGHYTKLYKKGDEAQPMLFGPDMS